MAAVTLIVVILGLWLTHSYWWPRRPCRACKGRKTGVGSTRGSFNHCHWCEGGGSAVRAGARIVSALTGRPPRGSRR